MGDTRVRTISEGAAQSATSLLDISSTRMHVHMPNQTWLFIKTFLGVQVLIVHTPMQGNCASPFPTSTNLGIQSFQPSEALPEKSEGQCLILLDGRSAPGVATTKPPNDVHFTHSGLVCASTCTEDLLIAEMTHAMETYPILVQNILFHSVNPSTKTALRVQRNAVLTNVSVSGTKGGAKTAVFTGPAGAVHLEGMFLLSSYCDTHLGDIRLPVIKYCV